MGNRRKLSDAQLRQIRELLSAGMSLRQIAKQIGVSAQTVSNYAKAMKPASQNTDGDGRYSTSELRELWYYCRNQTNAAEIMGDLAGVPVGEARRMIEKWKGRDT